VHSQAGESLPSGNRTQNVRIHSAAMNSVGNFKARQPSQGYARGLEEWCTNHWPFRMFSMLEAQYSRCFVVAKGVRVSARRESYTPLCAHKRTFETLCTEPGPLAHWYTCVRNILHIYRVARCVPRQSTSYMQVMYRNDSFICVPSSVRFRRKCVCVLTHHCPLRTAVLVGLAFAQLCRKQNGREHLSRHV
jgi:hypothetical protein